MLGGAQTAAGVVQWEASNVKFWLSGTWNTSPRSTSRRTTCGTGCASLRPTRRRTSCATSRSARTRKAQSLRSDCTLAWCRVQKTEHLFIRTLLTYWWIKILYPVGQSMVGFLVFFLEFWLENSMGIVWFAIFLPLPAISCSVCTSECPSRKKLSPFHSTYVGQFNQFLIILVQIVLKLVVTESTSSCEFMWR